MLHLDPLDASAVGAALEEATRRRQLAEPGLAESICRDILEAAPESRSAVSLLIHAICDQLLFDPGALSRARQELSRIETEYERELLTGVVLERHARALLRRRPKGSRPASREGLLEAIRHYEAAEAAASEGSLEAVLRRNGCARALMRHGYLREGSDDECEQSIE